MDSEKRRALEAAGWRFGDAADFLRLTDEERQFLDARITAALAVRRQREAVNMTQQQLASRIKTSQPRIARIERAAPDVSLDQILRAFTAAGGRIAVKRVGRSRSTKNSRKPAAVGRSTRSTVRESSVNEVQIHLIEE
ncbi:MAG TPA: helix-turn-helix domain-containing protein [Gemmataceae bacterium]|nr:helix-turn-helix domain-containing protein [Gemmataceae bacterium]